MATISDIVTVEVPAELVVEAAATLIGAAEYEMLIAQNETELSEACDKAAGALLSAASGTEDDADAFWRDYLTVEAYARAHERIARRVEQLDFRGTANEIRRRGHGCPAAFAEEEQPPIESNG